MTILQIYTVYKDTFYFSCFILWNANLSCFSKFVFTSLHSVEVGNRKWMNILLFDPLITLGLNIHLCTKIVMIEGYRNKCPSKKCDQLSKSIRERCTGVRVRDVMTKAYSRMTWYRKDSTPTC